MSHITQNTRAQRKAQEAARPPKPPKAPDTEAQIQTKIIAFLKRRGAIVTRVNSGHLVQDGRHINLASAGTSDLICLYRGKYLALEIKCPKLKPTGKQQAFLEAVRLAGGIGMVLTSVADAEVLLDAIKGDRP